MKIQVISENRNLEGNENTKVSMFSSPMALDDFDINIVDLSWPSLWKYDGSNFGRLNIENDLHSIAMMVNGSKGAKIIYVYPQNCTYSFHYRNSSYLYNKKLKDVISKSELEQSYTKCFSLEHRVLKIIFEPTKTTIGKEEFSADFHFNDESGTVSLTKSNRSEKVTTIKYGEKYVYTTLDVCKSITKAETFALFCFNDKNMSDIPEWIKEYEFGKDAELKEIISECENQISELRSIIDDSNQKLAINNRFKSILYTNGEALVKVVFDILQELLDYDLSEFVDEKREDFRIEKENVTFIGEIKGISTNIKYENISQLEVHYQKYMDEIEETHTSQEVHALLIINPLRTKALNEREPVHKNQIQLAERYNSLIIETSTLLKLFELFQEGIITSADCERIFSEKIGILKLDDIIGNPLA